MCNNEIEEVGMCMLRWVVIPTVVWILGKKYLKRGVETLQDIKE